MNINIRNITLMIYAVLPFAYGAHASEIQRGGTFTYAVSQGEPASMDCQMSMSINTALRLAPHYSTLVKVDPSNPSQIIGDLAKEWAISEDGKELIFNLHDNVIFHNGSKLTAIDVKTSIERIVSPPKGVASPRKSLFSDLKEIQVEGDQVVKIILKNPYKGFIKLLTDPRSCILSKDLLDSDKEYPERKVMGSGPFRFVKYTPGHEWTGERFEKYFVSGRPYLDGFRALSMTSSASINAVSSGQAMTDFRGFPHSEVSRIKSARGDKVNVYESESINLLLMVQLNNKRKELADERVRRAIAMSLDHIGGEKLVQRSTGTSAPGGFLRPGSEYARTMEQLHEFPGFSKDMEKARNEAKKLLEEAGVKELNLTFVNRKPFPYVGVFLIDQLRRIGINVKHDILEDPQYLARREAGDYDLLLGAFPDSDDDPSLQWINMISSEKVRENYSNVNDKVFDEYYKRQKEELNNQKRKEILQEAEAYMLNKAYLVPFFWGKRTIVMSSDVQGYVPSNSNWVGMDLSHLWIKK